MASAENFQQLIDELRQRVKERQEKGFYPEGLEADLAGHFTRLAARRSIPTLGAAREAILHMKRAHTFDAKPSTDSRLPGGSALHRTVERLLSRHVGALQEQLGGFVKDVSGTLEILTDALDRVSAFVRSDVGGQLDFILDRLALYESNGSDDSLRELRRRVEILEAKLGVQSPEQSAEDPSG